MRGILFLAILSIKSSYSRGLEIALEGENDIPDTVQWWFGGGGCWRIRTYALDHDIHAFIIGNSLQTTLELAKTNTANNFGDVIKEQHVIHFVNCDDSTEVNAEFGRIGLVPRIDIELERFAFWKPDDEVYSTKSAPRENDQ